MLDYFFFTACQSITFAFILDVLQLYDFRYQNKSISSIKFLCSLVTIRSNQAKIRNLEKFLWRILKEENGIEKEREKKKRELAEEIDRIFLQYNRTVFIRFINRRFAEWWMVIEECNQTTSKEDSCFIVSIVCEKKESGKRDFSNERGKSETMAIKSLVHIIPWRKNSTSIFSEFSSSALDLAIAHSL